MEFDNALKERLSNGERSVWVAQGNEVRHLGEAVDDREHNRLAADLGKSFNEIHGNVAPDRLRHIKGLEQTGGVQMISFIALAHRAAPDVLAHHA
jgi:hypothetical protein